MSYTSVRFADLSSEKKDILIATLPDAGYEGFEETDDCLQAYISSALFDNGVIEEFAARVQAGFSIRELPDTNWNEVWESNFEPVVVDDFCTIRADFHAIAVNTTHEILITPKMSFGTGHHATTFMMIQQLSHVDLSGKTVLDFGTGTGVLAILAEKMGASHVVAVDNDEWSISNAAENLGRNQCRRVVLIEAGDANRPENSDVILANITRNIITDNFSAFKNSLTDKGILLLSGLLKEDEQPVHAMAEASGFVLAQKIERNNWISLRYELIS
jgi:ribosomal protein L11 methyltransferase